MTLRGKTRMPASLSHLSVEERVRLCSPFLMVRGRAVLSFLIPWRTHTHDTHHMAGCHALLWLASNNPKPRIVSITPIAIGCTPSRHLTRRRRIGPLDQVLMDTRTPNQFGLVFRSRLEWTTGIQRVHGASAQVSGISLSIRKSRVGPPVSAARIELGLYQISTTRVARSMPYLHAADAVQMSSIYLYFSLPATWLCI